MFLDEPNFAIAAVESELACTLMYLMGFEETVSNARNKELI